ncbi:putative FERM domain-containing protein FRMD8P1 isoform X2 [Biomphalaria glabrata]|uniref:FERM domain-containing protein 8 n=1 Tax=Biomphalaria glabrata TaxID=6526 RepID=A0A9W2ZX69_BIOGL|nr:putative FERM domain-containing protein FRMD8P1 isoform X2 [Biomphalaria glabrata]
MAEKQKRPRLEQQSTVESAELLTKTSIALDDVMNLVVFLRDRTGIHFTLEDAPLTRCDSLVHLVLQEQSLPIEAAEAFCLWLISPILDLRLKKEHNPFIVVQKWEQLCFMYTEAPEKEISESEPVLMLQRDVFLTRQDEQKIIDERILFYLYHEAKYNVNMARYILNEEDYHTLAGYQAIITFGVYDKVIHKLSEYKSNLDKFYPVHMYLTSRCTFLRGSHSTPCEQSFMDAHIKISKAHGDSPINLKDYYKKYLHLLWTYPFYGGAFFSGSVEAKTNRLRRLISTPVMKITLCINTDGVSIFNKQKPEFLLYVPYSQLSWHYKDEPWDGDNDPLPTLMLQFLTDEQSNDAAGRPVTKLLQVFSREAKLMNALIETCVNKKLAFGNESDFVDNLSDITEKRVLNKLDRMTMETFTQEGEPL